MPVNCVENFFSHPTPPSIINTPIELLIVY